jgi:hypothetical protein
VFAARASGTQGKDRLRPVQRLNLALLIDAQDDRFVRRIHIKSDDIANFPRKLRIAIELEQFDAMWLQLVFLPDSLHVAELTFCAAAIARTLHCVASFGVVFMVASTMAASRCSEIRLGRPLRCRSSSSPAMPSVSNRFRHTVGTEVDSFRATTRFANPSAASRTMLMRRTMPREELR